MVASRTPSAILSGGLIAALTRELAHELLHRKEERKKLSKTVRETEAEAVAFVVGQAVGTDVGAAASDFIQLHSGDKDPLAGWLDRIQKTSAAIIEGVPMTSEPVA